ncbi:MAG: hypothetical protein ACC608_00550 [Anaerofustis sp.]
MKYKYRFEEIPLQYSTKVLVMRVDESIEMVTFFLFSDIQGRDVQYVLDVLDDVMSGKSDYEEICGNMCEVDVRKDYCEIYNMLADDGKWNWCRIETEELREFVVLWGEEYRKFRQREREAKQE